MTPTQIEELFFKIIEEKAIYNKLEGVSENMIYNWRKGRGKKPTTGEMLNVLYQLNKINVTEIKPLSAETIAFLAREKQHSRDIAEELGYVINDEDDDDDDNDL